MECTLYSIPLSFSDGYWGDQEKPATATDKQTGHSNQGWEAGQIYLLTTNRQEDANRALQSGVGSRAEIFVNDKQTIHKLKEKIGTLYKKTKLLT